MNRIWTRLRGDLMVALIIVVAWTFLAVILAHGYYDLLPFTPFYALPLLFRRQFPLPAILASDLAYAGTALVSGREAHRLSVLFFGALLTIILAGAVPDVRQRLAGGLATLVAIGFVASRFPGGSSLSDYVWFAGILTTGWVVGNALAARSQQTRELRQRIALAEEERALAAERAAAEERSRIARELHDVVAHSVSVMVVQASGVRRLLKDDQEREREALLSVERTGRQALAEMRRMLGVMRTGEEPAAALAPQPGLQNLDKLIAQIEEAGLPVTLRVEGERPELSPGVDLSAFRIVQEGLTNALKHAKGAHAEVLVRYTDAGLHLEVTDDGSAETNGDGMGHGLVGMRERVALYGGTLEAGPRDGGGFVLRADLPVEART